MNLRPFVLAIALLPAFASGADDLRMLVLDPLAAKNACACVAGYAQRDYDALAGYLGEALQMPVCPKFGGVLAAVEGASIIVGKQTEIEFAAKKNGLALTRIAVLTDLKGGNTLHGLFAVRSKDAAKTIADLKGKKILFGTEDSVEKHGAAIDALKQAGIAIPGKIETRDTCNQSAADVAERRADVAVVSSYALPLVEGCGTIGKGELKVIGRTADVPFIAVYVNDQFPAALRPALEKALENVAQDKHLCAKMESAKGFLLVKKK